jgi:hypothetical protein
MDGFAEASSYRRVRAPRFAQLIDLRNHRIFSARKPRPLARRTKTDRDIGFYGRQLLGHPAQPLMLAYDLFLEERPQFAPICAAHLLQTPINRKGGYARLGRLRGAD